MTSKFEQRYRDIPIDELACGARHRSTQRFNQATIDEFARSLGRVPHEASDDHVPAWAFTSLDPVFSALGGRMPQGSVHFEHDSELVEPAVPLGADLEVLVEVRELGERKGRPWVVLRVTYTQPSGGLVYSCDDKYLWGFTAL